MNAPPDTAPREDLPRPPVEDQDPNDNNSDDDDDAGTGMYSCVACDSFGNEGTECTRCGEDSCCYYLGKELSQDEVEDALTAMREEDEAWEAELRSDTEEESDEEEEASEEDENTNTIH